MTGGFHGRAYPVNRDGKPVAGMEGYASIEQIPDPIDLAVVCLPGGLVLDGCEAALRHGTRALCVISAGFAEIGSEGIARQEQLLALVRGHGARLIGPNCLGIASSKTSLNATFAPHAFPPGSIGFSSQSGALGLALLAQAEGRGLGFSSFVSIGNKADVSSNDLLEYWEDDPATAVVLLYLESFGNPRRFGRIARRVARTKPILAMKSGVTGAGSRAASSHTAALAGSEAAVSALFRQAGVTRCDTLEELIDVAALFSSRPQLQGTTSRGADQRGWAWASSVRTRAMPPGSSSRSSRRRHEPPSRPCSHRRRAPRTRSTCSAPATSDQYEQVLPHLLEDDAVDALIVIFVPAASITVEDVGAAIDRATRGHAKPVLPVLMGGAHPGSFPYPESAARALGRAAERADWLRRPIGAELAVDGVDSHAAAEVIATALGTADDLWLAPGEVRRLLEAYGISLVPERLAADAGEAEALAVELGFPAVVKTAEPGAHKTEQGGVALDLATSEEVRAAAERIGGPLIVQPMIEGGVELLAGLVQDPVFGPLVAFGPGGVQAELIGEARFLLAPVADTDARELVTGGKAGRLVAGFRGHPPADADALVDLVARLARLGEDHAEVAELDLNPVVGLADRLRGGRCACPGLPAHLPGHPEDLVTARSSCGFPAGSSASPPIAPERPPSDDSGVHPQRRRHADHRCWL